MGGVWKRRTAGFLTAAIVFGLSWLIPTGAQTKKHLPAEPSLAGDVKPMVTSYCVRCHSGPQAAAGLDLKKLAGVPYAVGADKWTEVARRLTAKTMPPPGAKAPPQSVRQRVALWIANQAALQCKLADPGHVTIRRLNREEYNNTIRDLTGLNIRPADDFPSDDVGYGFDNIGDVLSTSPLLMEKYISAAEHVAETLAPLRESRVIHFDASEMSPAKSVHDADEGGRLYFSNAKCKKSVNIAVAGHYDCRVWAAGDLAGPEFPKMEVSLDSGGATTTFEVKTPRSKPQLYEVPMSLRKGPHTISIAFTNDYYDPSKPVDQRDRNLWVGYFELVGPTDLPPPDYTHNPVVRYEPTPSLVEPSAHKFIERFATRAYRRPVTASELDRLQKLFDIGYKPDKSFEAGMQVAIEGVLVSPSFLFRVELDPKPGQTIRILNDYEIASRLSYFLWSSMPDDELFLLAREGRLHQTTVLNQQVERMIHDPKAKALADNFAGQWLQLRKLAIVDPDPKRFPGIDDAMKRDMATETETFFNAVLGGNRPISDFIDGKYTFVNERLANLYGLPGVSGSEFRRVALTGERGGVLTQASVLTITSNPTRTSPTKRGKWVLENILGTPPPPPPPGVGQIANEQQRITATSLRQLMEEHRKNPMCAACHAKMDPIGFGMENFDAVGRWRTMDGGFTLDTSGVLPDGRKFRGPEQLKQILLADKKKFAGALAEKLLTYGLGRGPVPSDSCAIDGIVKSTAAHGYRFADLIAAVVDSDPFRKTGTSKKQ